MLKKLDRLLGSLAYHLWDFKEGGIRLGEQKKLFHYQYLAPDKLQQIQKQRLQALLAHAYNTSPWYRKVMQQNGLDTNSNLGSFPVTTKLDIREHTDEFISTSFNKSELVKAKTGGSTGVSLNLYFDRHCQKLRNGAQLYADSFSGWKPGARIAAIWGNPPIAKTLKQKLRSFLLERMIYLDTMDLNPNSISAFVKKWQRFQPDMIFGHAHSIYLFAKYLHEHNILDLRPIGIVATSMMLLDHERTLIEQVFKCKVSNRYGCEEVGLIGVECEQHQGMHINCAHIILECLDDNNQPVAPGQPGKLVITDLNNFAMPLIRYRVEDVGVLSERICSCGRKTPLLERLEGRIADFLKKPDGGHVAGVSLVERTLTKIPGVEQMQLIQQHLHQIIINRVKGVEYTPHTDTELLREFREVFDESVELVIKDVAKIPQEKSGKYRFSICKI